MSKHQEKYHICKLLDKEHRILGLPLDEFIPIAIIVVASFLLKIAIWGLIAGGLVFVLLRTAKQGQGSGWLFHKVYWYAPALLFRTCFSKTPPSEKRHWLH